MYLGCIAHLRQQSRRRASGQGHAEAAGRDQGDWREDGAEGCAGLDQGGHDGAAEGARSEGMRMGYWNERRRDSRREDEGGGMGGWVDVFV